MHRSSWPGSFPGEPAAQRLRPNFWHPHATDPLRRRLWYAFWSQLGEIQLDQGELTYLAGPVGTDEVSVYAINENGDVGSATVSMDIQRP
jgi:hypothetical protein